MEDLQSRYDMKLFYERVRQKTGLLVSLHSLLMLCEDNPNMSSQGTKSLIFRLAVNSVHHNSSILGLQVPGCFLFHY